MSANTTLTVAQAAGSTTRDLNVVDAAYNLLNAAPAAFTRVASVMLAGSPTLSVAQFARLKALPGFAVDPGAHVTLADELAGFAAELSSKPTFFDGVGTIDARLDGLHLGAEAACRLAALQTQGTAVLFTPTSSHAALPIMADAQDLAAHAASLARLAINVPLRFAIIDPRLAITAAEAACLAQLPGFSPAGFGVTVSDSAANLMAQANAVFGRDYATIAVTGGVFAGSAQQLLDPALCFSRGASATLAANASVGAAQATALAALPGFTVAANATLLVRDTAAALIALPAATLAIAGAVMPSDPDVTLTAAEAGRLAAIAKFRTAGAAVTVTDTASAILAQAAALTTLPASAAVTDTAAAIGLDSAGLHALERRLRSVRLTECEPVSAAAAAGVAPFAALLTGPAIAVADNATNVAANLAALDSLGSHVDIGVIDTAGWIGDDAVHLATLGPRLTVSLNDRAPLTADIAASLVPLANQFAPGTNIDVTDTRAAIMANAAAIALLGVILDNLTFSDGTRIEASDAALLLPLESQLTQSLRLHTGMAGLLTHQRGVYALAAACVLADITVECVNAADAARHAALLNTLSASVTINDDASSLAASIDGLVALKHLTRVTLSDGMLPTLAISVAQHKNAAAVLARIATPHRLSVLPAPADAAGGTSVTLAELVLAAQRHQPGTRIEVRDTAHAIAADLASDTSLLLQGSSLVRRVALAQDGVLLLGGAASLAELPLFDKAGYRLVVWDEAGALTAPGATACLASNLIDTVHLRAPGNAVTLTAAAAVSLFAIPRFATANPDGSANTVTILDSAADISAVGDGLVARCGQFAGIVIDAGATITANVLTSLQRLGAVAAPGVAVTVRDTALSIVQAGAMADPSLQPDRWVLSGPAIVSVSHALMLARLAHFSAGPYQLTLSNHAVLTVAEANALGSIAACLSTGSHLLTVAGSDQERALLTAGAQALVQPALTDMYAHSELVPAATVPQAADTQADTQIDGGETAPARRPQVIVGRHDDAGTAWRDAEPAENDAGYSAPRQGASIFGQNHIVAAAPARAAIVNVYGEGGSLLSANAESPAGFVVTAPDAGAGTSFSITESVDGDESPPVVVLDAGTLEEVVNAANATFAAMGAIEVGQGKFLDLYTAGNVPVLQAPALVYDPAAHTVALDVPGNARVPLIILGASRPPPALEVSEILVRRHG